MKFSFRASLSLTLILFVVVEAGAYLLFSLFHLTGQDYTDLLMNLVFLLLCVGLVRFLGLTAGDLGLKIVRTRLAVHLILGLSIFAMYMFFYIFAVRISGLRPYTTATTWGILNYLVVVFAEEIYFRGILYGLVQKRYSGRAALVVSSVLFGLVHLRQGWAALARLFTGFLWGSVRYSTDMIFLLIIPIHLAYNVVWLLFQGNWDNPPLWGQFLPLFELALGLVIMLAYDARVRRREAAGQLPAR
jgi:membrane protease YdiL (CAAX protease family)